MSEQQVAPVDTDTTTPPSAEPTITQQTAPAEPNKQEPVVPEKYELTIAEGSRVDQAYLDAFQSYAKEQKMTQDQAAQLFTRETFAISEYAKRQESNFEAMKNNWMETVKKDPEIGGDNFQANVELAHRALEKYGTPQFKQDLEATGFGNHPELVRIFARIGKSMADDKFISPNAVTGGSKSYEDIFYGKQ